jgi:hypothetical protein
MARESLLKSLLSEDSGARNEERGGASLETLHETQGGAGKEETRQSSELELTELYLRAFGMLGGHLGYQSCPLVCRRPLFVLGVGRMGVWSSASIYYVPRQLDRYLTVQVSVQDFTS